LAYLLHLADVLGQPSKLLLGLVELNVLFFDLLPLVVDLVLLLLQFLGL